MENQIGSLNPVSTGKPFATDQYTLATLVHAAESQSREYREAVRDPPRWMCLKSLWDICLR